MPLSTFQSRNCELGKSRQQIQILRSIRAGILGSQNQESKKLSFMGQRETDFAAQKAQLTVGRIIAACRSRSDRQAIFALMQGFNQRTTRRQFRQRRRRSQRSRQAVQWRRAFPQIHGPARDAQKFSGRLQQPTC